MSGLWQHIRSTGCDKAEASQVSQCRMSVSKAFRSAEHVHHQTVPESSCGRWEPAEVSNVPCGAHQFALRGCQSVVAQSIYAIRRLASISRRRRCIARLNKTRRHDRVASVNNSLSGRRPPRLPVLLSPLTQPGMRSGARDLKPLLPHQKAEVTSPHPSPFFAVGKVNVHW